MNLQTFILTILCSLSESLIGLRPPSADPTYRKHQVELANQRTTARHIEPKMNETQKNVEKFIVERSYKNLVMRNDFYNNITKLASIGTTNDKAHLPHSKTDVFIDTRLCNHHNALKCSIRFLKSTIRQEYSQCQSFQDFSECLCPFCIRHPCRIRHSLMSIAADRNCIIQDNYNPNNLDKDSINCCEEELFNCTIDTYLSLSEHSRNCDSIADFTTCIAEFTAKLSNQDFDRIFKLLLSLTKTCILSIKPYEQ